MSLFDEPVKAHLGEDSVLWVGVAEGRQRVGETESSRPQAIVINVHGRVGLVELTQVSADWRWVPERAVIRGPEVSGPGWVDLEEYDHPYVPSPAPVDLDVAKAAVVEALTSDSSPAEGRDYLIGADGTKFDPSTNLPIDE